MSKPIHPVLLCGGSGKAPTERFCRRAMPSVIGAAGLSSSAYSAQFTRGSRGLRGSALQSSVLSFFAYRPIMNEAAAISALSRFAYSAILAALFAVQRTSLLPLRGCAYGRRYAADGGGRLCLFVLIACGLASCPLWR